MGKRTRQRQNRSRRTVNTGETGQPNLLRSLAYERVLLVLFWSYVLIPLGWGVKSTLQKAMLLFQ